MFAENCELLLTEATTEAVFQAIFIVSHETLMPSFRLYIAHMNKPQEIYLTRSTG
jgi:hypothetical protein